MITAIGLAVQAHDTDAATSQAILDSLDTGARWQVELRFDEVSAICSNRVSREQLRRPGNRMSFEATIATDRCLRQSPDGRGATWLLSGGDALAYGACTCAGCPIGR